MPFAARDSRALEGAFATLAAAEEGARPRAPKPAERVPVNEDFLFDVDIRRRELAPVYWDGPVYDVRRGTWFYQGALPAPPPARPPARRS